MFETAMPRYHPASYDENCCSSIPCYWSHRFLQHTHLRQICELGFAWIHPYPQRPNGFYRSLLLLTPSLFVGDFCFASIFSALLIFFAHPDEGKPSCWFLKVMVYITKLQRLSPQLSGTIRILTSVAHALLQLRTGSGHQVQCLYIYNEICTLQFMICILRLGHTCSVLHFGVRILHPPCFAIVQKQHRVKYSLLIHWHWLADSFSTCMYTCVIQIQK